MNVGIFPANELIAQFGFAGLIFLAFMFLLKSTLKLKERILQDAKEERVSWISLVQSFQRTMDAQTSDYREYMTLASSAITRSQADHQKILDAVEKSCLNLLEFRKQFEESNINRQKEHEKMIDILNEQQKVLARINGYNKHE